jgi:Flp pilus assembly pilin Flp
MLATLRRLVADQNGASSLEYGLAISLAIAGAVGVANEAGERIEFLFRGITDVLDAAAAGRLVIPPPTQ